MTLALLFFGLLLGPAPDSTTDSTTDSTSVADAAQQVLAKQFATPAHQLDVRVLRGPELAAEGPLRVVFMSMDRMPKGRARAQLFTKSQNQWTRAGWASLYVAHYDSVMVLDANVRAGDHVDASALRAVWMEITRFPGDPLRASDYRSARQQGSLLAAHHLREGKALRTSDVRPPYAANTGTTVEMKHDRRGLVLRLPCKAREPGFVGDVVRLFAPSTNTTYRARLTGAGTAQWIETLN